MIIFSSIVFSFCLRISYGSESDNRNDSTVHFIKYNGNGFFGTYENISSKIQDQKHSITQCGGYFKNIQNLIESPTISSRKICNLRCEYQIASPYICKNEFHVQFLNFNLESSNNCSNEKLIINNNQVFCGHQVNSRKYSSDSGILNITFISKSYNPQEGRNFKLLITRLPCIDDNDDKNELNELITTEDPYFLVNTSIIVEEDPKISAVCKNSRQDIPVQTLPPPPSVIPECCRNIYNEDRFIMMSQGFPAYIVGENDCLFVIRRSSLNVCRLKIIFKYFNLEDKMYTEFEIARQTNYECSTNFIEIEGRRFCGCKTDLIYETFWGYRSNMMIRLKTSPEKYLNAQGFIFEVIQEDCPFKLQNSSMRRSKRFIHLLPQMSYLTKRYEEYLKSNVFDKKRALLNNSCIWNHLTFLKIRLESISSSIQQCIRN